MAEAVIEDDVGHCPQREDGIHCDHWWDGEPCCSCGSDEGDKGDTEPDDRAFAIEEDRQEARLLRWEASREEW